VPLSFTNHHGAANMNGVKSAAHGIDRRLIGTIGIAASHPARRAERGSFGDTNQFERQIAIHLGHFYLSVSDSSRAINEGGNRRGLPFTFTQACRVCPSHRSCSSPSLKIRYWNRTVAAVKPAVSTTICSRSS